MIKSNVDRIKDLEKKCRNFQCKSMHKIVQVPSSAFADVNNPTGLEALTWAKSSLNNIDLKTGMTLIYEGTVENPKYLWELYIDNLSNLRYVTYAHEDGNTYLIERLNDISDIQPMIGELNDDTPVEGDTALILLSNYMLESWEFDGITWVKKFTVDNEYQENYVYVSSDGDDTTAKRGYAHLPYKTLDAALPILQTGDTLLIAKGEYHSSVTPTVGYDVDCDDGVVWRFSANPFSGSLSERYDYKLKYWDFINDNSGVEYIGLSTSTIKSLQLVANKLENVSIKVWGENSSADVNILKNARLITGMRYTPDDYVNSKIKVNTHILTEDGITTINTENRLDGANHYVEVDNLYVNRNNGGIFDKNWGADVGKTVNTTWKVNNAKVEYEMMYDATPDPFAFYHDDWKIGVGNNVMWIRGGFRDDNLLNAELLNFKGKAHGIVNYGYLFNGPVPTFPNGRIANYKITGHFEKGVPISFAWNPKFHNTHINVELDVVCDTSFGVGIFMTTGIPNDCTFTISGKIKTKAPGMPAIVLNATTVGAGGNVQTNGTITLKDLLMINDGTVPPIHINPVNAQIQEVQMMNVKSNSLILDANINEVGEVIVRNVNYK